jgi:uncharacterized repeat protein (TIGR01451 family)
MTSSSSHRLQVIPRRWVTLSSAVLIGLACVTLLLWGNQARAAPPAVPPDTLAPPSSQMPDAARLVPTTQISGSTCPLDVVVVFDRSGSMGYDPVCYGCWNRDPGLTEADIPEYYEYPSNGYFHPISTTYASEYCLIDPATGGLNPGGYPPRSFVENHWRYTIIEAELYSYNNSQPQTKPRWQGKGYWALQRDGNGSLGLDGRGGYMAHHPERTFYPGTNPYGRFYTLTDAQNGNAPLLEYRFWLNLDESPDSWGTQAYLWVRARRSACPGDLCTDQYGNLNRASFYWSLDDPSTSGVDFPPQALTAAQYDYLDGSSDWRWIRPGQFPISPGQPPDNLSGPYKLQLWAGSSGIRMDRIIITNNSSSFLPSAVQSQAPTPGSAWGQACDPCNPIYALTVEPGDCLGYSPVVSGTTDLRTHPLWGDWEQPLRAAKEAAKRSVIRLDPKRDQVGLVTYGTDSTQDSQLECISRWGSACYEGTTPISYTRVLAAIESTSSGYTTCTGCGMQDGLKVLGINIDNQNNFDNDCDGGANSHCARGGAKKVMILITDGVPNDSPGGVCDDQDYYPGAGPAYDCVIYFAQKAAERGVVIYPIGLGFGVDANLLEAVAEEGGGFYRPAYSASNLDEIFNEIISTTTTSCSPPHLILTKSAAPSEGVGVGDIITYSLSFSNTGDLAATHAVLTDRLPINTWFITASGNFTPPAPMPGDMITWNFGELMGGMTGTQQLALVISPTQTGEVITNVAAIRGKDIDDVYVSAQAILTTPFRLPPIDEFHSIYLPIILKR